MTYEELQAEHESLKEALHREVVVRWSLEDVIDQKEKEKSVLLDQIATLEEEVVNLKTPLHPVDIGGRVILL